MQLRKHRERFGSQFDRRPDFLFRDKPSCTCQTMRQLISLADQGSVAGEELPGQLKLEQRRASEAVKQVSLLFESPFLLESHRE